MDKQDLLKSIKEARQNAKKRKFSQTVDLIINLKEIDLKKEAEKLNTFLILPHARGKKVKVTALVGQELLVKARAACDNIIINETFKSLEKKAIKKIASQSDFFIAQSNIMPQVASTFGKILGPRDLMPNPKAGCVVQPTGELKPVVEKLQKTIRIHPKNEPPIKVPIGVETMKDEELADNGMAVYNAVLPLLPQEKNNLKSIVIKLTMGKPSIIGMEHEMEAKK